MNEFECRNASPDQDIKKAQTPTQALNSVA